MKLTRESFRANRDIRERLNHRYARVKLENGKEIVFPVHTDCSAAEAMEAIRSHGLDPVGVKFCKRRQLKGKKDFFIAPSAQG